MASTSHLGSSSRDDSRDDSKTAFVTSVSPRTENSGQASKEREGGEKSKSRRRREKKRSFQAFRLAMKMLDDDRSSRRKDGPIDDAYSRRKYGQKDGPIDDVYSWRKYGQKDGPIDDVYSWRKHGQKDICGAEQRRGYYRCEHRGTDGCLATKRVQRSDENPSIFDVIYRGAHTCRRRQQLVSPRWEIEQRESQALHPPILDAYSLKNQSSLPPVEFASSLKVLGWFVQMLFDKTLTATLQHWGVMADKTDLNEALQSLLDELNSVQAMLSLTQNFRNQNKGLLEILKNLMDATYDADDLLSEVDYHRLKQQVNDSEDEDLLRNVDYRLHKASISSTPPSFHDNNKATIVPRIHDIVSRLERLVTCLSEALSLLQLEEGLRANPNVFPVASHPLTTSFLLSKHGNYFEGLPESEFLSMFNKCAFGGMDPSNHLELGEIGKQIAGKLAGSLLAATLVGSLLRDNLDEQHWRSVLCSDIWQQRRSPDDIMPILRFSYHHLPAHLQQCFAYCGVFPKDWEFEKDNLVGMWISQGYIHTKSGNSSLEDIGSEYFDDLLSKSFIRVSFGILGKKFVLQGLLHDLAKSVSEGECHNVNLNRKGKIASSIRHIYADADNMGLLKSCNLSNLRTLIIDGSIHGYNMEVLNVLKEVLNGLKSIRVLCLDVSAEHLSGSIGHLIHLRYMTVRASYRNMPPDSQFRPYHLQWLIFETDINSPTYLDFPASMKYLVSLRHFASPRRGRFGKTGIVKGVSGIGKLTHLQELDSFEVVRREGHRLAELKRLNDLGGTLTLLGIENASPEEAFEANLNEKTGIRELTLRCSIGYMSPRMAEEVFEGLRPPPYIKRLSLYGYNGVKSPSWMMTTNHCLSYLQSLCLSGCSSWKVLPPLGELPLLRHLEIKGADSVKKIGSSFYGSGVAKAFPCLDTLQFSVMPKLVVWSGGKETYPLFPHLRELLVIDCPKLEHVPDMPSIQLLQTNCPLLLRELENLTSLKDLVIQDSRKIKSLPVLPPCLVTLQIQACPQLLSLSNLQHSPLEELHINSCNMIQSVPLLPPTLELLHISCMEMLIGFSMEQEKNLSDLSSLRDIDISDCPNLRSLPIMPVSLQELSIDDCPKLPRGSYQEGGDDWHKILHVPTIIWIDPISHDSPYHPSTSVVL